MDGVRVRAATTGDIPALRALQNRWETAVGGSELMSEDEIAEDLDRAAAHKGAAVVVEDGDAIVGMAWWWRISSYWIVDPERAGTEVHHRLLAWLEDTPAPEVDAESRDERSREVLAVRGWQHVRSAFDLGMDVDHPALEVQPSWPRGVVPRTWTDGDAAAVHDLVYRRAGWTDVPGHPHRDLEEWRTIFLGSFLDPALQVLAMRADDLVGVAVTRIFDDGTGWVSQLAVDRQERGQGLGRCTLLAALRGLRDGGATVLGLSVSAENRGALGLYRGVGLGINREWLIYER